ncbi:Brain-specific angiogenesis inhibitor 1-associated protein 2 [Heterocephalus glaber]|uniref:BAR/IMD domain-containing adapter protein 2 n=1 Tax=Heterocephalus glaber TaxID=10181 RepID=G5BJ57_HETGA|nr:Brain-specific angiogenesis inhibitor 1-associated protein 2 [Heterocephalus glaber]
MITRASVQVWGKKEEELCLGGSFPWRDSEAAKEGGAECSLDRNRLFRVLRPRATLSGQLSQSQLPPPPPVSPLWSVVQPGRKTMSLSRSEEMHRLTENVYKGTPRAPLITSPDVSLQFQRCSFTQTQLSSTWVAEGRLIVVAETLSRSGHTGAFRPSGPSMAGAGVLGKSRQGTLEHSHGTLGPVFVWQPSHLDSGTIGLGGASTPKDGSCFSWTLMELGALVPDGPVGLQPRSLGPRPSQSPGVDAAVTQSLSAFFQTIMEQFNPSLRNFIAMGKNYEKALAGVTFAAKGYFDALVKMGELASESQGSKELGDVLFQMAEVHRQIQNQLEETLKSFHNELLTQLEQKVELDSRYLSAALKKYQTEQRSKGDALDKCQGELKKLRKKSQGSKNPQKYSDKELQYIDAISNKQGELENYVSDGYKTALTEERRRFCFLVEKQCAVAKNSAAYHSKGKELLAQKLPLWQQACADPNKIPDRAVQLLQQVASSNGSILPSSLSASKSNLVISDPIPGAKPLPVPPELAPFVGRMSAQENAPIMNGAAGPDSEDYNLERMSAQENAPIMNGAAGPDSEDYNPWADRKAAQPKSLSPPQSQSKLSDSYSNTLPVRKSVTPKNSYATTENKTLPRSSSMAAGLERNGRMRVKAIFSHAAGDNSTLLSFKEGDLITLLVPEARDGWHYGESEKTKMAWHPNRIRAIRDLAISLWAGTGLPGRRGWVPFSYTRVLDSDGSDRLHMSLQQGKSSSTGNLLDKDDLAIPPPDYSTSSRAFPSQTAGTFKQRPYSVAVPAFSQGLEDYGARSVSRSHSGQAWPPTPLGLQLVAFADDNRSLAFVPPPPTWPASEGLKLTCADQRHREWADPDAAGGVTVAFVPDATAQMWPAVKLQDVQTAFWRVKAAWTCRSVYSASHPFRNSQSMFQILENTGSSENMGNPFANVQLKPTVTNDRSAPLLS